ncbi:MAG: septum formation initiator family protein [bacterium]|nr:septum formation initiator family protein [bacterium]
MPFWKFAILILTLFALGWGFWTIRNERVGLEKEANSLKADLSAIQEKNTETEENINYFKDPENLLKEAKSQFNYRAPGEELIIIVPEKEE